MAPNPKVEHFPFQAPFTMSEGLQVGFSSNSDWEDRGKSGRSAMRGTRERSQISASSEFVLLKPNLIISSRQLSAKEGFSTPCSLLVGPSSPNLFNRTRCCWYSGSPHSCLSSPSSSSRSQSLDPDQVFTQMPRLPFSTFVM